MKIANQYTNYSIVYAPRAQKFLKKLDAKSAEKIRAKIHELTTNSQNLDAEYYRLKVGSYEVIYVSSHTICVLAIIEIGTRENFYSHY